MARFLFMVIAILYIFNACQKANLDDVEELTDEKTYPVEKAKNIEYTYSDSAKTKAILKAPLMEKYVVEDPFIEMKQGLKVRFFNDQKKPNSSLRADYGKRYINRKLTECKGNVVAVNTDGDTLTTEHLIWNEKTNKIYSEKFVRVRTEDEIIKGEGFETDPSFSEYQFKNINMTINLRDSL